MTTNQSAIIIRECIREAAKAAGLKPSIVHNPHRHDFAGVEARNHAIRLAYAQGVHSDALADGFVRSGRTIRDAIARRAAPGECSRCGCIDPAECRDRCGSAPGARESADIDGASLV
jgi:hypothetical protein